MAGIYVHIPFCKQACHYCNFHFTTSLRHKNELINALLKETELRKDYLGKEVVETIYFGGGTPSLLEDKELSLLLDALTAFFSIDPGAEMTLEANPDDINEASLLAWKKAGINRLSIGVQSFFDEDLQWMNRAHDQQQAVKSLVTAKKYFDNITADLIYGTPYLRTEGWKEEVEKMIALEIPHLSCYALTVEPKTRLNKLIHHKKSPPLDADKQADQFLLLMDWLETAGYEHYEISNFAKPGFRSRHNSSYWQGKKYLGIGPSAHSFNGSSRQWNVANNQKYIDALRNETIPFEREVLTETQKMNEYIMTSLRTSEGMDMLKIDPEYQSLFLQGAGSFIEKQLLIKENNRIKLTKEGKLRADGIAGSLFFD